MLVVAPVKPKLLRDEREVHEAIASASAAFVNDRAAREQEILKLFDARAICEATPIMASGWVREVDEDIISIVADLLSRHERLSLLEIGAGTTWGRSDPHFGVPGLARALKSAFPQALRVVATDREAGFDIFLVSADGLLVHQQYRDDRPPKGLDTCMWRNSTALAPLSTALVQRSVRVDSEFAQFIEGHKKQFNIDALDPSCRIYLRPRIDREVEALLYGVHSVGRIDYSDLTASMIQANHRERFDLVYGRHLCPILLPSRLRYLQDHLPGELSRMARGSYVHFDGCQFPDVGQADLVFRHHDYGCTGRGG
jgi:hypothetical protein